MTKTIEQLEKYAVKLAKPYRIEYQWKGGLVLARTAENQVQAMEAFKFVLNYCEAHRPDAVVTMYFSPRRLSERAVVKSINLSL